jgi:hypothetical protein
VHNRHSPLPQRRTPPAATTATPSAEATTERAGECSPLMIDGKLRVLAATWGLVIAARGESAERDLLKEFQDGLDGVVKDFDDEDACEGSKQSTAAAYLDTRTAYLAASIFGRGSVA